ncbi:PadR family transcriptional regulator [Candidatus Micrarchaeota archaeon]|nr:PadR family transcriptional regulator [Candidatus Micrarchaeota archaeon]
MFKHISKYNISGVDILTKTSTSKALPRILLPFILWFISKKPTHGYEIINTIKKEPGPIKIGPGHVYPILSLLENEKLVKIKETKNGRRIKKLYTITPEGKKKLLEIKKRFFSGLRGEFLREMVK